MNSDTLVKTGSLIKQLRKELNLTQQDIANALHVSKPAVSQWESGSGIKTEILYKIAKYFDITVSELIDGRLDNESNADYWKRNYDLSNYDFDEDINNSNIDKLKELFEHCTMVKKEFYRLLPIWANNKLSSDKIEEFGKLKSYFKFDTSYWTHLKNREGYFYFYTESDEKECVKEVFNKFNERPIEYRWEITKLYDFMFDIKFKKICNSENLKAFEFMLSSMSQPEKDSLLNMSLTIKENDKIKSLFGTGRDATNIEIENIPYYKIMLNFGCNCLKKYKNNASINEQEFNRLESIEILEEIVNINEQIYAYDNNSFKNWKLYSYEKYQSLIDKDKTEYLKALVNFKDANPLKYYKALLKYNEKNV